jgi:hypothetical protein
MLNSPNSVSQHFELSASVKDVGIGFQFSRSKEGETKSPTIDSYGRVNPGVGVQDILEGVAWEKRFPVLSWKDASYDGDLKLDIDIGVLIGIEAEINFSEMYRRWRETYDKMNSIINSGPIQTNRINFGNKQNCSR